MIVKKFNEKEGKKTYLVRVVDDNNVEYLSQKYDNIDDAVGRYSELERQYNQIKKNSNIKRFITVSEVRILSEEELELLKNARKYNL